ncbi:MAG: hypothetical protein KKD94_01000 [Nanoarchaeota archaeon]|nr:hypothetical protein [Nanoarchaeota archaeon]
MKKLVFFAGLVVLVMLVQGIYAVSSDLRDSYAPKETMIGEFSGGILAPIAREQVSVIRDGHIDVAVEYDIRKLGQGYYIWLISPQNTGNYTLKVRDIIAFVGGVPDVVDYEKEFIVAGEIVDYSINPGFVFASDDFEIAATLYESSKTIEIDFPEVREINLVPGTNHIDFPIGDLIGVYSARISVGRYSVPAYILGEEYVCGDGQVDGSEVCDEDDLGGESCISKGYAGGTLSCAEGCLSFDVDGCELPEEPEPEQVCGSEQLELCLTEYNCTNVGGYWYNKTCNLYEEGAECDSEHVGLCLTPGTCLDAEGYWYNEICNKFPEPKQKCGDNISEGNETCDGEDLEGKNCSSLGYVGGDLGCSKDCLSYDIGQCVLEITFAPPRFMINPGVIRDTVLVSDEILSYSFGIVNQGENEIENLRFDYDRNRFIISPEENISIGVNETAHFNLALKESPRNRVRGVVVAYSGDVYEYLVFTVNLTSDAGQVLREYSKDSTVSGPSYYCSELSGGKFCSPDDVCSTTKVAAIDGLCCTGECGSASSGGSKSWIGYLLGGIVVLVIIILFVKYRKTGKSKESPLKARVSGIEKKL